MSPSGPMEVARSKAWQLACSLAVIRFILDNSPIFRNTPPADARVELAEVNGQPALVTHSGDKALAVLTIDMEAEQIKAIRFVVNPDKLAHI